MVDTHIVPQRRHMHLAISTQNRTSRHSTKRTCADQRHEACRLGFFLFLLVNVVLFVRPSELVPALEAVPLYEILIAATILSSLPVIVDQLRWSSLRLQPVTVCILGLLPVIVLSDLLHGYNDQALSSGFSFLKIVLYYLLLMGLVRSPQRFQILMKVLCAAVVVNALIALLQYYGLIHIESMAAVAQWVAVDHDTGEVTRSILRMRGSGIFGDPNDLALIMVTGILIAAHFLLHHRTLPLRLGCFAAILICGWALAMTSSRGGLLSMGAGASCLFVSRFGWKRSIPAIVLCLAGAAVVFGGRQTNIDLDNPNDTAQARIHLWRDGLQLLHSHPLFGTGCETYAQEMGLVAHNSYVHCYVELGFVGGTMFSGAIFCSLLGLVRVHGQSGVARGLRAWCPAVMAILLGYLVGAFSLTRTYVLPTYLILGLAAVYCQIVSLETPRALLVLDRRLFRQVVLFSAVFLVGLDVFVRLAFR